MFGFASDETDERAFAKRPLSPPPRLADVRKDERQLPAPDTKSQVTVRYVG